MSWLCTLTRRVAGRALLVATATFGLWTPPAVGQSLESVISPGAVAKSHEEIEHECGKCHVRFSPSTQPKVCLDCHREIRADVRAGTGYHGRTAEEQCRRCHTDHKGREAKNVILDEKTFDHRRTDFQLRGDHQGKACAGCHRPGVKHREAPSDCFNCHGGNDMHRGGLGARCESCHVEDSWKLTRFDHGRTRFPLLYRHAQARCADCHGEERYLNTPRNCASCHRNDDAHAGAYGQRCESCHTEQDWRVTIFRHDRDTPYPLLGQHRRAECSSCHRAPLSQETVPTQCVACHQEDDAHQTVLGDTCGSCHDPEGWREVRFDHAAATRFPLRDAHRAQRCETCHTEPGLRSRPTLVCVGCHERDDREGGHRGRYGGRCETCHGELGWRPVHFDHEHGTDFSLSGKHRTVRCDSCHRQSPYQVKADDRCFACHEMDDIHLRSFEQKCDRCHVSDDWRKIRRQATDKYCRPDPAAHRERAEDELDINFWIPACAAPIGQRGPRTEGLK